MKNSKLLSQNIAFNSGSASNHSTSNVFLLDDTRKIETEYSDNYFQLSNVQQKLLKTVLSHINYEANGDSFYIQTLRHTMLNVLPQEIIHALRAQTNNETSQGFLLIDNLPIDDIIHHTPKSLAYDSKSKASAISENLLLGFASLMGEPYAIGFETDHMINNLIPQQNAAQEKTSSGYDFELDFHTEYCAPKHIENFDASPQHLLLTGVKHDAYGPLTKISLADKALSQLTETDVAKLKEPSFTIDFPFRWRQAQPQTTSVDNVPVVYGDDAKPFVSACFYGDVVRPNSAENTQAYQKFHEAIKDNALNIDIRPGRMLIVDNRRALHAREPFNASFSKAGEAHRWIQSVFVAHGSLTKHREYFKATEKERIFIPK
jgi:L-asparagine oxygenase